MSRLLAPFSFTRWRQIGEARPPATHLHLVSPHTCLSSPITCLEKAFPRHSPVSGSFCVLSSGFPCRPGRDRPTPKFCPCRLFAPLCAPLVSPLTWYPQSPWSLLPAFVLCFTTFETLFLTLLSNSSTMKEELRI